jgi:hypothetical protein
MRVTDRLKKIKSEDKHKVQLVEHHYKYSILCSLIRSVTLIKLMYLDILDERIW